MTGRRAVRFSSRAGLPIATVMLLGGFAIAPAPNATPEPSAAEARAANLQISKVVSPEPLIIGGEATYVVTVTNTGDTSATGVTVTDELDANVAPGSPGAGCSADGQVVTCGGSGLIIPVGESQEFTIPVTVGSGLPDGTNIVNNPAVTADNASSASTRLVSQAQTSTDVEITKSGPVLVNPDGTISYDVEVTITARPTRWT